MTIRRVTPICVSTDMAASRSVFEGLGLTPRPTEDDGCIGYVDQAGRTGVLIVSREFADRSMPPAAADRLATCGGLYIWVDHLDDLEAQDNCLGEVTTSYGTRERFHATCDGLTIIAERLQAATEA